MPLKKPGLKREPHFLLQDPFTQGSEALGSAEQLGHRTRILRDSSTIL